MSSRSSSPASLSKLNVQASEWKPPTPPAAPASSRGESTPQKPSRTRRGGRSSRRGNGNNGNDGGRRTPQPQQHAPRESKQAQQLKVHAPGCSCARLARTRGRHAAEGRASGYVVASRDAKAPDLHFGSDERDFGKRPEKSEGAPAGPGERTAQRPAADRGEDAALRRRREALLSDAIADAVKREANGPARVSCAACMLDGAWRNGAIAVAGPPERVGAACAAANRALFGDFGAGRFPPAGMWHGRGAPVCVPISVRGLLQSRALGTAVPLPPDYAMPPPPPGCYPLVDAKHHVVEVFDVISFPAADDHLLVLCTVDAYGVLSLDLPGGKRRLAETAWEAAAREAANVAGLRVAVGGDRLGGADGALDCGGAAFRAEAARDGQSVRFFVLRAEEAAPDDMPVDEAP